MKKVAVIIGSPRKSGNSTILARRAVEGIAAAGGESETFRLNSMSIRPCQACDACRRHPEKRCVVRDDMHLIYDALETADAVLLAFPIYMFCMSAQLKLFLDRCYAVPDVFKGKRMGILLSYADDNEVVSGAIHAMDILRDLCAYRGMEIAGIVHGSAEAPGEIAANAQVMDEAFTLGKALAG
jgi:multimeric flavodoxin WrbA